ncbi:MULTISPECIES: suppressor of fused domain protein [Rathayibacter]|jgi:hypothetical protein|uniref:Uncharacterized protein n=2 Tax=Rathayibacter festucae TaxID=110937 RepID=A0A3Q9UZI8_9MICO|nr:MULTISPECIES: suppressor of fused domain protein [Rathayibacter]AZZ53961.1 hypothetical protein C1I64_19270 [Rathayibacter festucae DSM 15932]MCJ1674846.1 suppressor of fused domain protein [Rathayibacter sp. VKM Ac-2929]MCJ1683703.1 suppressor of fused domain protein [Rathayibacter sp. VKM Ac-2928]MCJ1686437.1 suppressor of fused domain protein [Rathayibacter sp. VKM Ac-2927]MCJ1698881.1 suppressor of fused domain protein [Rathayibacter festucae]
MSLLFNRTRELRWTPDERKALAEAVAEDRAQLWRSVGDLDRTVVVSTEDPGVRGGARWPTDHRAFLRVERGPSVVLATDGLSDPFDRLARPGTGLGLELCLETSALRGIPAADLWNHWQFRVLYEAARLAALQGVCCRTGVDTATLPGAAAPAAWADERGSVGVLLGLRGGGLPERLELATGDVELVTVTPLWPEEYAWASVDTTAREEIASRLRALPHDELVHTARPRVV